MVGFSLYGLFCFVLFLTETIHVFHLHVTVFQNLLKLFDREGIAHFCTSEFAQPEGKQEERKYRAITLNKFRDGKITETCWKQTVTERFVIKFVWGFLRV